jgi:hypothetical protein
LIGAVDLAVPQYKVPGQLPEAPFVLIKGPRVLDELETRGANEARARELTQEALERLGGEDRSHYGSFPETTAGGSGPKDEHIDVYAVPREAMRE